MSPPGRPKGEYRSAKREGTPVNPPGRPKGEYRSAKREGTPVNPPGRPKGEYRSAKREGARASPPPADGERALRSAVIATALAMNARGVNRGKSGNVSARLPGGDGFLVTPTGLTYEETRPKDIVAITDDGAARGSRLPSSEWRFHLDIYRARPDVDAIVHTHAPFATTLACLSRGIPAFHYMVALAGGRDIRCAPYATFGTQELSDRAVAALDGRKACLLAHHGMIAVGASLSAALALAVEVETLAEIYWRALSIAQPETLADAEMDLMVEKFRTYGQPRNAGG